MAVGADGSMAISDKGDRRIIRLSPGGELKFALNGGRRSGGFYSGKPVGFGPGGSLVVSDSVANVESSNTERDAILLFSASGSFERTLYARDYSEADQADYTKHMIYIQANESFVSWFLPDPDGVWTLHVLPFGGEGELEPLRFEGIDLYDSVDVVLVSPREIYVLQRDGSILRRLGDGVLEPWFENGAGEIRFPSAISADAQGGVYVLDGKRTVLRVAPSGQESRVQVLLDRGLAIKAGYMRQFELAALAIGPGGSIHGPDEATGEVLSFRSGNRLEALSVLPLRGRVAVLAVATLVFGGLGGLSILCVVALFYARILRSRNPLLLRQLAVFVPLLALASVAIAFVVFSGMNKRLQEELRHRIELVAQMAAERTDASMLDRIDLANGRLSDILDSGDYAGLEEVLAGVVNGNEDPWNSEISPNYYVLREGEWFIIGTIGFVELYPDAWSKPEFSRVLEEGAVLYTEYQDVYGSWLSAMRPVRRADGSVAAVLEVSMSADILAEARAAARRDMVLGTLGLLALLVAVFSLFDWMLLSSVKELKRGAEGVAAGDYDVRVDVRSRDEIEELGDAFNTMSSEIKRYVDRLASMGRANARFVPREFLAKLGYESITDVGLGDQVLTEMTVLFSDIRSFTTISEAMGPARTMDLLNDYLARMGPAIRAAGGFIDKYVGDSIMALFPDSPVHALSAAFSMMGALDTYRAELESRGETLIEAGIGIHVGRLMLGVIGEEERFEGTVIADAVNLASRLESLTKYYGVRAVVSGAARDRSLPEPSAQGLARQRALADTEPANPASSLRFIDLVRVKGKTQVVRVYELVGPGDPMREAKLGAQGTYIKAFTLYRNADFAAAGRAFGDFLAACPGDKPAELLKERCARLGTGPVEADWEGVTEFHEK